jgi:deoxyribodipyrimidine photo-lyase
VDKPLDRALVWLRRDLRVDDHAALYHALRAARQVWCAFVFDRAILDPLPRADRRVEFIRDSLVGVDAELRALAHRTAVEGRRADRAPRPGDRDEIPRWPPAGRAGGLRQPRRRTRGAGPRRPVRGRLADAGVALHTVKDHVIFERSEVLTPVAQPFSVFTPYKNAWLKKLDAFYLRPTRGAHASALAPLPAGAGAGVPALADIGFAHTNLHQLRLPTGPAGAQELLDDFLTASTATTRRATSRPSRAPAT